MSQHYNVLRVTGAKEWTHREHGRFIDWYLDVQESEESLTLTQKKTSDDPHPGDVIWGHIEVFNGKKRDGTPFTVHKLKRDQEEDSFSGPHGAVSPAEPTKNASFTPGSPADTRGSFDARGARIERQHSQEMAIRLAAAAPELLQSFAKAPDAGKLFDTIEGWTNQFCEDLDAYERARFGVGGGGSEGGRAGDQQADSTPAGANQPVRRGSNGPLSGQESSRAAAPSPDPFAEAKHTIEQEREAYLSDPEKVPF